MVLLELLKVTLVVVPDPTLVVAVVVPVVLVLVVEPTPKKLVVLEHYILTSPILVQKHKQL